ncbi:MAG: hypothetical protein WCE79_10050 [Xanthobacteraceae bacterium]
MTKPTPPPDEPARPVPVSLLQIFWQPVVVISACAAFIYILVFAPQTYSGGTLLVWTTALTGGIVIFYVFWRLVITTTNRESDWS